QKKVGRANVAEITPGFTGLNEYEGTQEEGDKQDPDQHQDLKAPGKFRRRGFGYMKAFSHQYSANS
ncbi:MAG: hypothetical protein R6U68_03640, partial [Desulfobacteraceae bacterium]